MTLEVPSRSEWVGIVRLAVAGVASKLAFDDHQVDDLRLAASEACALCVLQSDPERSLIVEAETEPGKLFLTVRGFRGAGEPDLTEEQRETLEAAEYVIRSVVDEADIGFDGDGMYCRLSKSLTAH
jgi:anti-sigma regulatory factor (Ser/Thr protein kinase)